MIEGLIILGLALAYRLRGHRPWPDATGVAKLYRLVFFPAVLRIVYWGLPIGACAYWLGATAELSAAVGLLTALGLWLPHGEGQDMGNSRGRVAGDLALMWAIAAARSALFAVPLALVIGWPNAAVMVIGISVGQAGAYLFAQRGPLLPLPYPFAHRLEQAELYTGAVWGAAIVGVSYVG